jgi:hypothetical protein
MRRTATIAVVAWVLAGHPVFAQDLSPNSLLLPGSMNTSIAGVGPLEPGNAVATTTLEQGLGVWRRGSVLVLGVVDAGLQGDTQGFAWNNTAPVMLGGKVVAAGPYGVVQGVVGVAGDLRSSSQPAAPVAYGTYWASWHAPAARTSFPGRVWVTSGRVTPRERRNWITSAHVEQGVTMWRGRSAALAPFLGATAVLDTEGRAWNQHGFVDAGIKALTRVHGASIELGAAQRIDRSWTTGRTGARPFVFANVWVGWTAHVIR